MRKFIAYIIMMLTAFSFIIFNSQNIFDSMKIASEYGNGTELSFAVTQRDSTNYETSYVGEKYYNEIQTLDKIDVKSKITQRLETAGIRNAEVSVVNADKENNGMRVNVRFTPISDVEKDNLKTILSKEGFLVMSTAGNANYYVQTKNELFATTGDVARVTYNGTVPYIAINLKDTSEFDSLKANAENDGGFYNPSEDEEKKEGDDSNSVDYKKKLYLWSNLIPDPTLNDTFLKATGLRDTKIEEKQANRLLAVLDVDNYSFENKVIGITLDKEGKQFTISGARALANAINSADYGFDMEFLYETSLNAYFSSNGLSTTYLIFGLALLVGLLVLIAFYGISGLTAGITMIISIFVSILTFSFVGFEFSVASICALIVLACLSSLFSVNYFEHTKNFFKKGSSIEKASRDGYKNSFIISVDAFAITLIISLFGLLISVSSFKTFFGVLMIGSIVSFIITMFLDKWLTYWLVKDKKDSLFPYFTLFKKKKDAYNGFKYKKVLEKTNVLELLNPVIKVFSIVAISLAVAIPSLFIVRSSDAPYFNASDSFADSYVLNVTFRENLEKNEELVNKEDYVNFIKHVGNSSTYLNSAKFTCSEIEDDAETTFKYDLERSTLVIEEKTDNETDTPYFIQYFSLPVDRDLNDIILEGRSIPEIIDYSFKNDRFDVSTNTSINHYVFLSGDSNFEINSFVSGCYLVSPVNLNNVSINLIVLIYVLNAFAFVYFLIRYGFNFAISQLITSTLLSSLAFSFIVFFSIAFTSYLSFGLFAIIVMYNLFLVPFGQKNKSLLKEKANKEINDDIQLDVLNESYSSVFETTFIPFILFIVFSISLVLISKSVISLGMTQIVLILFVAAFFAFIFLNLYYYLSTKIKFIKFKEFFNNKKFSIKKTSSNPNVNVNYVDVDGPHETIIEGLNDFRK